MPVASPKTTDRPTQARDERVPRPLASSVFLALYRAFAWLVTRGYAAAWSLGLLSAAREPLHSDRLGRWRGIEGTAARSPVWIHAASVGEVALASAVIKSLKQSDPSVCILLTCNTPTGRRVALASEADKVFYLPLDSPWILKPLLDVLEPRLLILVETEIWPNLLLEAAGRRIPAVMVNARISDRSLRSYRRIRPLMAIVLDTVALVCARDAQSRQRLIELGADAGRTFVVGDLKYDGLSVDEAAATTDLLEPICGGSPTLLAASTHSGEDEVVLDAFSSVMARVPQLRLVLAPRHPERSDDVAGLASGRGFEVERWSSLNGRKDWQVLVVDTVGELRGFMRTARGAFVGGSLVEVGGHNLLEPAIFALPMASGPSLTNVAAQAEELAQAGALKIVDDAEGLAKVFDHWIGEADAASEEGRRGRELISGHSGALRDTAARLEPLLRSR